MADPAWLLAEWKKMGSPVSERQSPKLDKWYSVADEAVLELKEAALRGDWVVVREAAEHISNATVSGVRDEIATALLPIVSTGSLIEFLDEIRTVIDGRVSQDEMAVAIENLLYDEPFLDSVEIYPAFAMDGDLNRTIAAFIDRVGKIYQWNDTTTPREFAALFTEEDITALDSARRLANSRDVRTAAVKATPIDNFVDEMAAVYYEKATVSAVKDAKREGGSTFVRQWRDGLRAVWDSMGKRDHFDIFLTIDSKYVTRHPRLEGTTHSTAAAVTPGTEGHVNAWASVMLERARAIFQKGDFIKDVHMRGVFSARHVEDAPLKIEQVVSIGSNRSVYLASRNDGKKWVVKHTEGVEEEEEAWLQLRDAGGATPNILQGYNVFGLHVLVVERLFPLDHTDDEYEMGKQLLDNQFPFLHTFAVHSDIKPDNIMKRVYAGTPARVPDYFLIDMDLAQRPSGTGFLRVLRTPPYASDRPGSNFPMTWRDDILEFLYTLHALALHRQFISEPKVGVYGPNKLTTLYEAKVFYDMLPPRSAEKRVLASDLYADPLTMKSAPGTVLWDAMEMQLKKITSISAPLGIRDAFSVLAASPHSHPKDAANFKPYKELVAAFTLTHNQLLSDVRRDFMPVEATAMAGPFAGAHVCWTCARTPKKLQTAEMFRENARVQRVFCGKRCQEVFHETPENCERM